MVNAALRIVFLGRAGQPVGDRAGAVWSLKITRADKGVLEDNSIKLAPRLPPTLSFTPEQVFGIKPQPTVPTFHTPSINP